MANASNEALGKRNIFLLEDDPETRIRTQRMLHSSANQIIAPEDEYELRVVLETTREDVALALLDVVLNKAGWAGNRSAEFIQEVRRAYPNAKLLLYTGEAEHTLTEAEYQGIPYLRKPAKSKEFQKKIQEILAV